MSSETYHAVAQVGEIADGSALAVELGGEMIAVFRSGDEYFALKDSCPHQGAPLSDGEICEKAVTCTWHGWRFSLEDGRWLDSPKTKVPTYPVRVVDGRIEVAVTE